MKPSLRVAGTARQWAGLVCVVCLLSVHALGQTGGGSTEKQAPPGQKAQPQSKPKDQKAKDQKAQTSPQPASQTQGSQVVVPLKSGVTYHVKNDGDKPITATLPEGPVLTFTTGSGKGAAPKGSEPGKGGDKKQPVNVDVELWQTVNKDNQNVVGSVKINYGNAHGLKDLTNNFDPHFPGSTSTSTTTVTPTVPVPPNQPNIYGPPVDPSRPIIVVNLTQTPKADDPNTVTAQANVTATINGKSYKFVLNSTYNHADQSTTFSLSPDTTGVAGPPEATATVNIANGAVTKTNVMTPDHTFTQQKNADGYHTDVTFGTPGSTFTYQFDPTTTSVTQTANGFFAVQTVPSNQGPYLQVLSFTFNSAAPIVSQAYPVGTTFVPNPNYNAQGSGDALLQYTIGTPSTTGTTPAGAQQATEQPATTPAPGTASHAPGANEGSGAATPTTPTPPVPAVPKLESGPTFKPIQPAPGNGGVSGEGTYMPPIAGPGSTIFATVTDPNETPGPHGVILGQVNETGQESFLQGMTDGLGNVSFVVAAGTKVVDLFTQFDENGNPSQPARTRVEQVTHLENTEPLPTKQIPNHGPAITEANSAIERGGTSHGTMQLHTRGTDPLRTRVLVDDKPLKTLAASDSCVVAHVPEDTPLGMHQISVSSAGVKSNAFPADVVTIAPQPIPPLHTGSKTNVVVHVDGVPPQHHAVMHFEVGGAARLQSGASSVDVPVTNGIATVGIQGTHPGQLEVKYQLSIRGLWQ